MSAAATLIAVAAWANGRVCFGPGIGLDCRQRAGGSAGSCVGCVTFTCDANCDTSQDYFYCIGPGLPFCYGLGVKAASAAIGGKRDCAPCGGGSKSAMYPWKPGHEPHPPDDRPEPVLRAHADGRILQYYLEKGDAVNAHLFVDVLLCYYQVRHGKPLTMTQQKLLVALTKNPAVDAVMNAKVQEVLEAHRALKLKKLRAR